MRLRLQITTPTGASRSFEHAGPSIRIGRDPAGELCFEGADGRSVSWNHARIELTSAGATLADVGSSNGTLLNAQPVSQATPVRPGDRIQLGYTGACLEVAQIDLAPARAADPAPSAPAQVPAAQQPMFRPAAWAGVAVAASVVLVIGGWLLTRGSPERFKGKAEVPASPAPPSPELILPPAPPRPPEPSRPQAKASAAQLPSPIPAPPGRGPENDPGAGEAVEVGRYVALPQWGPAVLLQRRGEAYPWTPLRPESKILTGATLVCLPGYRTTVALDSGLQMTLWGNLPEFSKFPPVLESVVMLSKPDGGLDLDLALERGRVHLINSKSSGSAHVQLRLLRQTWQLWLEGPGQEACVELWPLLGSAGPASREPKAAVAVGVFIKGKARLQAAGHTLELGDRSRVSWINVAGTAPQVDVLPDLPEWWSKGPDQSQPPVADAMLSLLDWSTQLNSSTEVMDTILTRVRESRDATLRVLGLLFLASLDGAPFLVDFLEDRQHAEVRGVARHALQIWLSRRPDNQAELARILKEKRGYTQEKGALIGQLLVAIPEKDLAQPETYQKLVGYLDHENLIVRDLAFWHLAHLMPEGPAKVSYDPLAEGAKRRHAVEQWRQLVPAGNIPRISSKSKNL